MKNFNNTNQNIALNVRGQLVPIPLVNAAPISASDQAGLNVKETFTVQIQKGKAVRNLQDFTTGLFWPVAAEASPFTPTQDSQVLERLRTLLVDHLCLGVPSRLKVKKGGLEDRLNRNCFRFTETLLYRFEIRSAICACC